MKLAEWCIVVLVLLTLITQAFLIYIVLYQVEQNKQISYDIMDISDTLNSWEIIE